MADPDKEIVFHFDDIEPDDFKGQVWDAINEIESGVPLEGILKNAALEERLTAAEFAMVVNYTNSDGDSLIAAGKLSFELEGQRTTIRSYLGETPGFFRTSQAVAKLKELIPKFRQTVASEVAERVTKEVMEEGAEWLVEKGPTKLLSVVPIGGIVGEYIFAEKDATAGSILLRGVASEIGVGPIDITTVYDIFSSEFYWTKLPKLVSVGNERDISIDGIDYSIDDDGSLVEKRFQNSEWGQELSTYCRSSLASIECIGH